MRDGQITRVGKRRHGGRATAASAAAAAAAVLAGGPAARAVNYTLAAGDAFGTSSLTTALNFQNNGTASNPATDGGVDTYNTSGFTVRTPSANTSSFTFGGASLQVDAGGRLLGKEAFVAGGGTLTVNSLILNGGVVDEAYGSNDNAQLNLAGTITVNAPSTLGAGVGEFLNVQSAISGSAGLTIGNSSNPSINDPGTVVLAGSLANYTGTFNVAAGTLAFNQSASLSLANPVVGVGTLQQLANNTLTLTTADTVGSLRVRAGTVTTTSTIAASSFASIGLSPGDNGTLTLPAGTSFANGTNDFNIADQGGTTAANASVGTVNLTGGTLAVGTVFIGKGTNASNGAAVGLLNMTAGTLTAAVGVRVGVYGTGTFNQAGGATTVTGGFTSVGLNNGSVGVYNLTGGTFADAGVFDVNVGDSGTGVLNIGGGAGPASFNASLGTFYVGRQATARGTVNLNPNGTLTVPAIAVGSGGTSAFNFNGGTLVASNNSSAFMAGANTVNVLAGGAVINTNGFADTIGRNITSGVTGGVDGGLTKLGAGTLTLAGVETYTGVTNASAGTVTFPVGTAGIAARQLSGGVFAANGGLIQLPLSAAAANRTVLVTGSVGTAGLGRVDLANGDLISRAGSLAAVNALAAVGFAGGLWTGGGGLTSSAAAADTSHLTAIGVIPNTVDGTTPLFTTFDGQPVTAADVLAKYTYYGDANLDGVVNAADYTRIDAGFVNRLTGWVNGDFNYDGVVDGTDYALMDNAFNQQAGGISPSTAVGGPAASPAAAVAAVPEPAVGSLLAAGVAPLMSGRRRRTRRSAVSA